MPLKISSKFILRSFRIYEHYERYEQIISFLIGVSHDCFKLMYAYLNEGYKICECYSCMKMMIQTHLHVAFFYNIFQ